MLFVEFPSELRRGGGYVRALRIVPGPDHSNASLPPRLWLCLIQVTLSSAPVFFICIYYFIVVLL